MAMSMTESESEDLILPGDCAPKIRVLFDYWRSIHPESGLPGRGDFDPVDIPELLPNVWMVDVARAPLRFRFRVIGTEIVKFTDHDHTGRWLDEVYKGFTESPAFGFYRDCVEDRRANYRKGRARIRNTPQSIEAEQLTLPLATNGRDVDILLMMTLYADLPPAKERYWDSERGD